MPPPVLHSLPLMGIGNQAHQISDLTDHSSLPLMGIGNAAGATSAASASDSLPLMGIGNRRAWSRPAPTQSAHYPSWGSVTAEEPI